MSEAARWWSTPRRERECRRSVLEVLSLGFDQIHDLMELCREEIERRHDGAVGTQAILLHDLLVVHRVADINVGRERYMQHGWIEIDNVSSGLGSSISISISVVVA